MSLAPEHALEIGTAVLKLPAGLPVDLAFNLNEEGRLMITALETSESRSVEVNVETASVIQGEELEKAKIRNQALVVH